ncbi:FAD/NAD(P)-binding domain-containing protein [Aspergillus steynii IBT 23096]|uniref:FAD/NAD(P)-binding domain-containing protein n=1 Tax=Aspergillus steynii IBT 23096 TaxID=1392250 RepID=A0A2I2FWI2_9EURO|nr:FAD/NAD(P)-binding domain-containing protein [Aspergillus steynii IBT 23096]PLB44988.1 FAD/NAD(P)-binding domain-containing protein [Aspergillus steynii IBT 23096]
MSTQKNIVVLGGSFGGISAAHHVLKHAIPQLADQESHQVILVSPSATAICRPACPRAMISDDLIAQDKLFINIPECFEQYPARNFRFVHGTATGVDQVNRNVSVDLVDGNAETIDYHALVIATGASTRSPLITLLRDEKYLRQNWASLREALPSAKSIVIAGGGPSGVEIAGELGEYLNGRAGWFSCKLENPKVPVTVVTSASQILPDMTPGVAAKAEGFLALVGVTVIKNTRVETVTPADAGTEATVATKTTVTLEDGKTLEADIYIPAMGATPNTSFLPESLLTSDGRVETNTSTLRVDKAGPRVYGIGDATSFGKPSIHNITEALPALGANIKRDLLLAAGKTEAEVGEDKIFKEDTRTSQLVPIGQNKGVGLGMGYQLPSSVVWAIKGRDYWTGMLMKLWNGKQWD